MAAPATALWNFEVDGTPPLPGVELRLECGADFTGRSWTGFRPPSWWICPGACSIHSMYARKKGANTQVRAPWTEANQVPSCTSCLMHPRRRVSAGNTHDNHDLKPMVRGLLSRYDPDRGRHAKRQSADHSASQSTNTPATNLTRSSRGVTGYVDSRWIRKSRTNGGSSSTLPTWPAPPGEPRSAKKSTFAWV